MGEGWCESKYSCVVVGVPALVGGFFFCVTCVHRRFRSRLAICPQLTGKAFTWLPALAPLIQPRRAVPSLPTPRGASTRDANGAGVLAPHGQARQPSLLFTTVRFDKRKKNYPLLPTVILRSHNKTVV